MSENCGELMANGFWNDLPCDNLAPFACKMEATTEGSDPSLPETTTQVTKTKTKTKTTIMVVPS